MGERTDTKRGTGEFRIIVERFFSPWAGTPFCLAGGGDDRMLLKAAGAAHGAAVLAILARRGAKWAREARMRAAQAQQECRVEPAT